MNPEEHMGLIGIVVKELYSKFQTRIEYEDFTQILSIGLIKACKSYKSEIGLKFSTYACTIMKQELFMFLRHDGMCIGKVHDRYQTYNVTTLTSLYSEDGKIDYFQQLPDELDCYGILEEKITLQEALKKLKDKEKTVIIEQFFNKKSQQQIARECGISQIEVSRRKISALKKLKYLVSA